MPGCLTTSGRRAVVRFGPENVHIHPKIDCVDIVNAPIGQHLPEPGRRHEGGFELIVDLPDITPRQIHHEFRSGPAEITCGHPQVSFRKMRMIKANHRNAQVRAPEAIAFHAT